jgi:hypothetical protein
MAKKKATSKKKTNRKPKPQETPAQVEPDLQVEPDPQDPQAQDDAGDPPGQDDQLIVTGQVCDASCEWFGDATTCLRPGDSQCETYNKAQDQANQDAHAVTPDTKEFYKYTFETKPFCPRCGVDDTARTGVNDDGTIQSRKCRRAVCRKTFAKRYVKRVRREINTN